MTGHPDGLTLLQFTARELSPPELRAITAHLAACDRCSGNLEGLRRLDRELRQLAATGDWNAPRGGRAGPDDPFRARPAVAARKGFASLAGTDRAILEASDAALTLRKDLLDSISRPPQAGRLAAELSAHSVPHRLALLYALQEAGRQSAMNPLRLKDFATEAIDWVRRAPRAGTDPAEGVVPLLLLRGHAHLLFAVACLWTKEFSRARTQLIAAYRTFSRSGAGDTSLALVELAEAQRRALTQDGASALPLARRARETFEAHGLEDYAARSQVAEGIAHAAVGDHEEAIQSYFAALPVFERCELWSNYVGALNSSAMSLTKLGRFDEARRAYARALRRLSRYDHKYWLGYLRIGFAEALFAAWRFADAAVAASRAASVFADQGLRPHSLIALLLEVECWARHGRTDRARSRLGTFSSEVASDASLDPAVVRELADALSGANPDYERVSALRSRIDTQLRRPQGVTSR